MLLQHPLRAETATKETRAFMESTGKHMAACRMTWPPLPMIPSVFFAGLSGRGEGSIDGPVRDALAINPRYEGVTGV